MTITEAILARFCHDFEDFSFSTQGKSRMVKAPLYQLSYVPINLNE